MGQVARIAVQVLAVVLLSRLLDPTDFGLVAMVMAVIGVAEVVRDFGLTQAAIQARSLSAQQRSNLFWINSLIGLGLTIGAFALSWPIAALFDEPRLVLLTQALSVVFFLNGLSTQYRAQMARDMRFGALSAVEAVSPTVALALAAWAAVAGWGYWALAVQQISMAGIALLGLVVATRWFPSRYRRGGEMGGFLRYGGWLMLAQLVTYGSKNVDAVVLGARLGAPDLGYYNRAFQMVQLPLNQINAPASRVALPVLSRLQTEPDRFNRYMVTAQSIFLQPVAMMFALGAALASPVVMLLLGPGWEPSVPVFQALAVSGILQAASNGTYWVFLAKGATRSQLWWALLTRPLLILTVIVGSAWGLLGVAWGYTAGTALLWPLGLLWISRTLGAPGLAMLLNGLRAIAVYGTAGVVAGVIFAQVDLPEIATIALSAGAFFAVVAVGAGLWPAFRRDIVSMRRLLR
ncbi:lipopolysaccharide biosynthesis protein [Microbacterium sp.]|uniref:lipopolysaccharide biosynthesis protein n=1 Tax=Microbacterium sp. TaxID=51671 RepID=UPI003A8AB7B4